MSLYFCRGRAGRKTDEPCQSIVHLLLKHDEVHVPVALMTSPGRRQGCRGLGGVLRRRALPVFPAGLTVCWPPSPLLSPLICYLIYVFASYQEAHELGHYVEEKCFSMITGRGGTASAGWRGDLSPGMPGHLSPFAGSFGPRGCQSGEQPRGNVAVAAAARLKGEALCPGHDLREAAWGVGVRKKDWGSSGKSNIPFQVPRNSDLHMGLRVALGGSGGGAAWGARCCPQPHS